MDIYKINVKKIIIHQIFRRDENGNKRTPEKSTDFILFDRSAMDTFKSRVLDAVGSQSKAVPMEIVNQGPDDIASLINQLTDCNDGEYIEISYKIADKLAESQRSKRLPGGIVVVFSGTYGDSRNKFVGIMKAEIHSAYEKKTNQSTKEITLKYVEEALLTPATKLYKTAFFTQVQDEANNKDMRKKWLPLISDSQISKTEGKAAAFYFYSKFLGCGYPESSAKSTKEFYDATSNYLKGMDVSEEVRSDYHNALVSYLKYEKSEVVNPNEFAARYFDSEEVDLYIEHLEDLDLPTQSFAKNLEFIGSKLKIRKLSFSKNVKITAPSQVFKELIKLESINMDESGQPVNWTNIIVKDKIVAQE
ncbi:nucleoid-associated protein [Ferrimonas sp. SCSIO 43195]|uniref:nucleoid-associated protein n=1 Tax=Ferrimonas sp. SCSIO 43195 TaxID=2822844 RepID=UPI002074C67F|nr:nucleoid-associated protein [Ferrimonas sp. SCSIO 43195]USD36537.1 nucleoid-associated protein [Ferrimonas sp. SCSIO 43195]